jgi:hypothetical protein
VWNGGGGGPWADLRDGGEDTPKGAERCFRAMIFVIASSATALGTRHGVAPLKCRSEDCVGGFGLERFEWAVNPAERVSYQCRQRWFGSERRSIRSSDIGLLKEPHHPPPESKPEVVEDKVWWLFC